MDPLKVLMNVERISAKTVAAAPMLNPRERAAAVRMHATWFYRNRFEEVRSFAESRSR